MGLPWLPALTPHPSIFFFTFIIQNVGSRPSSEVCQYTCSLSLSDRKSPSSSIISIKKHKNRLVLCSQTMVTTMSTLHLMGVLKCRVCIVMLSHTSRMMHVLIRSAIPTQIDTTPHLCCTIWPFIGCPGQACLAICSVLASAILSIDVYHAHYVYCLLLQHCPLLHQCCILPFQSFDSFPDCLDLVLSTHSHKFLLFLDAVLQLQQCQLLCHIHSWHIFCSHVCLYYQVILCHHQWYHLC